MPRNGMKPLSYPSCREGSPAPSALHVRVVLSISTSAGIACPFPEETAYRNGRVVQTFPDMEELFEKEWNTSYYLAV